VSFVVHLLYLASSLSEWEYQVPLSELLPLGKVLYAFVSL
jgi:hypothetical protein